MTRARTASLGVAILTAIQPLLGAVLMLCVSLVQDVAATLGMIFNRNRRDWHTASAREDLPQAKSGIQFQESNTTHGVIPDARTACEPEPRDYTHPCRGFPHALTRVATDTACAR